MKTEARFLLAVLLMLGVLVGTNRLFPPAVPEGVENVEDSLSGAPVGDTGAAPSAGPTTPDGGGLPGVFDSATGAGADAGPGLAAATDSAEAEALAAATPPDVDVVVESPLYRYTFSSTGARVLSGELLEFDALNHGGVVEIVPDGAEGILGHRLVVGSDTLDLTDAPFRVEPEGGLRLTEGDGLATLRFIHERPGTQFRFTVEYTFAPDRYQVGVRGEVEGIDRALLVTDMGPGLAYAEADSALEARAMAYVYNHLQDGIRSTQLDGAEPTIVEGPLLWAAFRSKFFVVALQAGETDETTTDVSYLGGLVV